METRVGVIDAHARKVDGIKISLLDEARRSRCAAGCPGRAHVHRRRLQLRRADRGRRAGHSDALLGIFDAIAPAASRRSARSREATARFDDILGADGPLSRHVFAAPTRFYKTGVVFIAWLNGHQSHFTMVGGQQSARSLVHLRELFRLADAAGLLRDPALATHRMRTLLALHGSNDVITPPDPDLLSINTATVRQQWRLPDIIAGPRAPRIRGISPWRDQVADMGLKEAASRIRDAGLVVSGLCRGGMFPAEDRQGRRAALDDNRRAVDEALTLGARCLVLRRGRPAEGPGGAHRLEGQSRARARWCATGSASCTSTRMARACRSPSSRCTRCTRPTARA
jgi:hypothetical protein